MSNKAALCGTLFMTCNAASKNSEFHWYHNGTDLGNFINKEGSRYIASPTAHEIGQSLTISHVTQRDTGTYVCSVDNSKSNGFECQVIAPPVLAVDGNMTVFASQNAVLSVNISYNDNNAWVIWSKCSNTSKIRTDRKGGVDQFWNSQLILNNVTTLNAGCYNVSVHTSLYSFNQFALIWLFVIGGQIFSGKNEIYNAIYVLPRSPMSTECDSKNK